MSKIKTAFSLIQTPRKMIVPLADKGLMNWIPDKLYLQMIFRAQMDRKLDLKDPRTYNEKLQWLKLYDHNPLYHNLVDKYEVKKYVADIIGEQYIIPTIGIWKDVNNIPFSKLPEKYVLKCTHDSGSVIICHNKAELDVEKTKKKLKKCLKRNFYKLQREWPYKDLEPRIIAEMYMEDIDTEELRDYKFFCFDGVVKAMFIATDRQSPDRPTTFDFYDDKFTHLNIRHGHPNAIVPPQKPINYELMKNLAERLSKGIPHVRVDFYEAGGSVYFGELTFYHHGGLVPFDPDEWDTVFGKWLQLPHRGIP